MNEEIPKITKLCNAINQMVLELSDKNKELDTEVKKLKEQVAKNKKAIESLKFHLENYVEGGV